MAKTKTSENRTKATTSSPAVFIAALIDPTRRADAKILVQLMQRASGEKPVMWGPSIIGFGSCHYKYESGREGDMPLIGFSPRKAASVLYGLLGPNDAGDLLAKLGKHSTGKGCLYIKKMGDIDSTVLETLIKSAVAHHRAGARKSKAS